MNNHQNISQFFSATFFDVSCPFQLNIPFHTTILVLSLPSKTFCNLVFILKRKTHPFSYKPLILSPLLPVNFYPCSQTHFLKFFPSGTFSLLNATPGFQTVFRVLKNLWQAKFIVGLFGRQPYRSFHISIWPGQKVFPCPNCTNTLTFPLSWSISRLAGFSLGIHIRPLLVPILLLCLCKKRYTICNLSL